MIGQSKIFLKVRVELRGVSPSVWREVLVPSDYRLPELHEVLQIVMGWYHKHLHVFRIAGVEYSSDKVDGAKRDLLSVSTAFKRAPEGFAYVYDFGDNWIHDVTLVEKVKAEAGPPMCLAGAMACPPEDVGGPGGYEEMLSALADRSHEEHADFVSWLGGGFDPTSFNARHVSAGLIGWWRQRVGFHAVVSGEAMEVW